MRSNYIDWTYETEAFDREKEMERVISKAVEKYKAEAERVAQLKVTHQKRMKQLTQHQGSKDIIHILKDMMRGVMSSCITNLVVNYKADLMGEELTWEHEEEIRDIKVKEKKEREDIDALLARQAGAIKRLKQLNAYRLMAKFAYNLRREILTSIMQTMFTNLADDKMDDEKARHQLQHEQDIEAAAAKVKSIRDHADKKVKESQELVELWKKQIKAHPCAPPLAFLT